MRRILAAALLMFGFAASPGDAQTPSTCPGAASVRTIKVNAYTLTTADNCWWIYLTFPGQVTLTLPTPNQFFNATYGVTIVPSGSTTTLLSVKIDPSSNIQGFVNGSVLLPLGAGQGAELRIGAGPNWNAAVFAGGSGQPGGAIGSIQSNAGGGNFKGLTLSSAFSTTQGGGTVIDLASGASCFNLGPWTGSLSGPACGPPSLSAGAAAANVGALGGALSGALPNPSLVGSAVFNSLGAPGGDLGGASYTAPLVTGLRGFPIANTAPTPQSALVWNGTIYSPQVISPGINQLSGDALAGPGSGLQTITIQPAVITNAKLAPIPGLSIKANSSVSMGPPKDVPVAGGLAFLSNGSLGLAVNGLSQQYAVTATDCLTIANGFITGIAAGTSCGAGNDTLVADDGTTVLNADDSVTPLLVDGGAVSAPCNAGQADWSLATGCNIPFGLMFVRI